MSEPLCHELPLLCDESIYKLYSLSGLEEAQTRVTEILKTVVKCSASSAFVCLCAQEGQQQEERDKNNSKGWVPSVSSLAFDSLAPAR